MANTLDSSTDQLVIKKIKPAFGVEVEGINLQLPLSSEQIHLIRSLLTEHKIFFFREAHIDSEQQKRFASFFGPLTPSHPVVPPVNPLQPEVLLVGGADLQRNDVWHSDVTFVVKPPAAGILRAVNVPPVGGDTNWADLEASYDSLSAPIRELIDQLYASHSGAKEFGEVLQKYGQGNSWEGETYSTLRPVVHPVVRVHPTTGRKSIFVNPNFTTHILNVSTYESESLLSLLYAHISKPEHVLTHRWRNGDVAYWDNRNTAHYANYDYGSFPRIMERVTLQGEEPLGVGIKS